MSRSDLDLCLFPFVYLAVPSVERPYTRTLRTLLPTKRGPQARNWKGNDLKLNFAMIWLWNRKSNATTIFIVQGMLTEPRIRLGRRLELWWPSCRKTHWPAARYSETMTVTKRTKNINEQHCWNLCLTSEFCVVHSSSLRFLPNKFYNKIKLKTII